jgi:hypothetical protein
MPKSHQMVRQRSQRFGPRFEDSLWGSWIEPQSRRWRQELIDYRHRALPGKE